MTGYKRIKCPHCSRKIYQQVFEAHKLACEKEQAIKRELSKRSKKAYEKSPKVQRALEEGRK